jgi:hypothetical protein
MEAAENGARSPTQNRSSVVQGTDSKLFARRPNNANPSAFEKKLVAARDKERQPQVKSVKGEKQSADTLDTIRQWQRHYRKAFPQFVFYFDSIPDDVRRKFSRQVIALGAVSSTSDSCFISTPASLTTCVDCHDLEISPSYANMCIIARGKVLLSSSYPRRHITSYSRWSRCHKPNRTGGRQWRQR